PPQQALVLQQAQEGVRGRRAVAWAWVQLPRQRVEGFRAGAEVGEVEDGFRVGEAEAREVGVEAGGRGAEVWDPGGGADAGAGEVTILRQRGLWM
ncbi:hypothetical protein Tdes44962_MAKER10219, partial [Teratosphaeria destructans]